MSITDAIQKLIDREDLTLGEAREAMEELMAGKATDAQIAAFLTALRMKGESSQELAGFAGVMRERAVPFWEGASLPVIDTCGTGGDRSGTFNISTASAFVVAGAGLRVAKHGNRSASSKCGSADVMEALGVDIAMPVEKLRRVVSEVGIGFLFAQRFHSSMRHVMPARTQMKVRTVFNLIGPLSNPAQPQFQVIGASTDGVLELMANALKELGTQRALVVHGTDQVDEISISAPTRVVELHAGEVRSYSVNPETFGVPAGEKSDLAGGDAAANARIIESILGGEKGVRRNVVLINAAAALLTSGAVGSLQEGVRMAAESVDSGRAADKLRQLQEASQ